MRQSIGSRMVSHGLALAGASALLVFQACGGSSPGTVAGTGGNRPGSGGAGAVAPGTGGAAGGGGGGGAPLSGSPVDVALPDAQAAALAAARADVAADLPVDAAQFQARWGEKYLPALPYDPLTAQNLDRVQASQSALNDREQSVLAAKGFVISGRQAFPTFFDGYTSLYADHLPLYVSLDSVLHAVHRSYDTVLVKLETGMLEPALIDMLSTMHTALSRGAGADLPASSRVDVDLLLTVALSLLGQNASPVAGADPAAVADLLAKIAAAQGTATVDLFGEPRDLDFSQFTPRGHYTQSADLSQYFQSMMWLGRTDLRFLQYDPFAGSAAPPRFSRRQFLDGLLLAQLAQGQPLADWTSIEQVLHTMVGESDNMTVADFAKLPAAAGVATLADLPALSDQALAQALLNGGFGIQRIASQLLVVPFEGAGAPLDRVFLLLGQRFVIDSQVFTDVTFDRVRGEPKRMMPTPLDVAFAALGNDTAVGPLVTELGTYPGYPAALHEARRLVDQHGDDFWGGSFYTLWLSALRGLSPPPGDLTAVAGLPAVMRSEPWARRLMNTQLASWAQLRHDTLLYAKQSYTAIPACEFPDAYVDPYPEAWDALVRLAKLGQQLGAMTDSAAPYSGIASYFASIEGPLSTLRDMAAAERAGTPFTADQMAFINQAVSLVNENVVCTTIQVPGGWYPKLFIEPDESKKMDPTIADVHTDPYSGQVLHVATGLPRIMVVTADTCTGPHAYVGLVSSYFEETTEAFQRLTDMDWLKQIMPAPPADAPWLSDVVVR